ncbi:hypothetical protein PtB15_4B698 [Puccinia triticina]|nr:hypothetical protein PtB15_4B698 [Puccinia triticina]
MAGKILQEKLENDTTAPKETEKDDEDKIYSFFSGPSNNPGKDEIETYLGGVDRIIHGDKKDCTFSALKWWKVLPTRQANAYEIIFISGSRAVSQASTKTVLGGAKGHESLELDKRLFDHRYRSGAVASLWRLA